MVMHFRHGLQAVMPTSTCAAGIEKAFASGALWRREDP